MTIEAARAKEAGGGFFVVAPELKRLADQAARATGQIAARIASIQKAAGEAVGAVTWVGETIKRMAGPPSAIGAVVEEQGAATREIAASLGGGADASSPRHAALEAVEEVARVSGALQREARIAEAA